MRFTVELKELTFGLGEVEPLFLSLLVFDVKSKKRITETFHFQMNSDFTLSLVGVTPVPILYIGFNELGQN